MIHSSMGYTYIYIINIYNEYLHTFICSLEMEDLCWEYVSELDGIGIIMGIMIIISIYTFICRWVHMYPFVEKHGLICDSRIS